MGKVIRDLRACSLNIFYYLIENKLKKPSRNCKNKLKFYSKLEKYELKTFHYVFS